MLVSSLWHTSVPTTRITWPQKSPRLGDPALGDSPSQALRVSENQTQRDALTRLPHFAHGQPLLPWALGQEWEAWFKPGLSRAFPGSWCLRLPPCRLDPVRRPVRHPDSR